MNEINLISITPEIILCVFGLLIMVIEPFLDRENKHFSVSIAMFAFIIAAIGALVLPSNPTTTSFYGMVTLDSFGVYFRLVFYGMGFLLTLASLFFVKREVLPQGEYFALLLFAVTGMDFMVVSSNLILTFIGLEILSIATYVLAGIKRDDPRSNESSIKYFFMGAFSSAIMLYGIALIYGTAGSLCYQRIMTSIKGYTSLSDIPLMFMLGFGLLLVGFCFKVAVAPFQIWAPDVYQGAPTTVTAFMSVGPKAAAFAALVRVLFQIIPNDLSIWTQLLIVSSILTMIIGNMAAITQDNIKRMLAYSSIAHAGYILIGIVAANITGLSALLYYVAVYTLMNVGAFTIVSIISGKGESKVLINDYKGLGFKYPLLSIPLTIFLISLAGIPTTAGFIGKFFLFSAAVKDGFYTLVIVAVIASLVSVYYYLRVVVYMFMYEIEDTSKIILTPSAIAVVLISSALIIYFGIFPSSLLNAANRAVVQLIGL